MERVEVMMMRDDIGGGGTCVWCLLINGWSALLCLLLYNIYIAPHSGSQVNTSIVSSPISSTSRTPSNITQRIRSHLHFS